MSSQGRQLEIDATNLGMTSRGLVCLLYDLAQRELLESRALQIEVAPYQYNRYQKQKCCDDLGYFVIPLHNDS